MPPSAAEALRRFGENLAIARVRRRESQRQWAERIGISLPTLIRMEQGSPAVAMGVYLTALWLIGQDKALPNLADPKSDVGALELDVRKAMERKSVRKAGSVAQRLAQGKPKA